MVCYACGRELSDKELAANSIEDFIENKALCSIDLSISNELVNQIRNDKL